MSWSAIKSIAGHRVYDVVPTKMKVNGEQFKVSGRSWRSPVAIKNGSEVQVYCPVGCLSMRHPGIAIVKHEDESVHVWIATDSESHKKPVV